MTIEELFNYWKENYATTLCTYAVIEGGPGYVGFGHCSEIPDVKYGGKLCEGKNCSKFYPITENKLFMSFYQYYNRNHWNEEYTYTAQNLLDYYNEKYTVGGIKK